MPSAKSTTNWWTTCRGSVNVALGVMSTAATRSLVERTPKPSEIPKTTSRTGKLSAFMLRQRNPRRQSSRMLTERINPKAMSGMMRMPRLEKDTEDKVTMTEASKVQRKMTSPNRISPENAESAERKTSMQTKKRSAALAM